MKKYFVLSSILILLIPFVFQNCNRKANAGTTSETEAPSNNSAKLKSMSKNGITLTELYSPETFDEATILQNENSTKEELDKNMISIQYNTTGYELGKQTAMTAIKSCANSAKGQHIHCLVDGGPYNALYEPNAKVKAEDDGMHYVLSFLSRSYHESIKNKKAYSLTTVITGMSRYTAKYRAPNLDEPMLFYSRPKGEYIGAETDAVLLDFYLVNCDLSKSGYKVKAVINGTEFILDKWSGYFMEGLPMGENTVQLTLLDEKGNTVASRFNEATRKFTLKK